MSKLGDILNWKCLKNTEEDKSSHKCRSGCPKMWKRMRRSSRDSKLEAPPSSKEEEFTLATKKEQ